MAVTFFEERKTQRYLIMVFIGVLLISFVVIWQGFFKTEEPLFPDEPLKPFKKIEINYKILENPILKELQLFEEIVPFEEEPGRENPFLPY